MWASNDVLTLFGINHSKLVWWGGGLDCTASKGKTPILADCQEGGAQGCRRQGTCASSQGCRALARVGERHPVRGQGGNGVLVAGALRQGMDQRSETSGHDAIRWRAILAQLLPVLPGERTCRAQLLQRSRRPLRSQRRQRLPTDPIFPAPGKPRREPSSASTTRERRSRLTGIAGDVLRSFTGTLVRRDNDPASTFSPERSMPSLPSTRLRNMPLN